MRSPRLTITIVTLNRRDMLEKTLWYIYETTSDDDRDIWIWDNGSTDDTPDFLGTLNGWPGVRVFRSKTNDGCVPPRKRMLPHIKTPYFFALDDDIWVITKGWVKAIVEALDNEPTLVQLMIPQEFVHGTSNYGIIHAKLDRPFFRVPYFLPESSTPPKGWPDGVYQGIINHLAGPTPHLEKVILPNEGYDVVFAGNQTVAVPRTGTQLPFACPGGCSAWRTADILPLVQNDERHNTVDLREAWSFPLQKNGRREGCLLGYGVHHPSPGPLWYLGRGEVYWEQRCNIAREIYGRSDEEQRSWLENARKSSGWGSPLEDPDVAFGP